jgi:Zn-dependent M28 family amino/carboxypeptidase
MSFRHCRLLILSLACGGAAAAPVADNGSGAIQAISPERIAAQVRFLSSDLLEGRGTGARGGDIAAEYIATQFALDGLQPAGDNGSYLQKVNFIGLTSNGERSKAQLLPTQGAAIDLRFADDYVFSDESGASSSDIDAPIVFAGFGIDAPEYGWNDYADTDVRGKVVLVFVNEPESSDPKFFNGPALTYYGRWSYKYEEAARRGAVGVLIIHRSDLASYGWDVVRNSWTGENALLANEQAPRLQAASWIQLDVARKLFAAGGRDLDAMYAAANTRGFEPFELAARFHAHLETTRRDFQSSNVLAMLPGRTPGPARQVVLYSAHYDHLGIIPNSGSNANRDTIYNGAVDNGTGCGILLELAHALGAAKQRPLHPILFASVTAEEKGLLGSRYLGLHPPVPAGDITLHLNYDAINPVGLPQSVTVLGAERTTFYPHVLQIAQQFHLAIEPDANPGAGHYYRSDHFSTARVGIPAFSIRQGERFVGHEPGWGRTQEKDYTEHHYHDPSDEYRPDMDFRGNAELARFGLALGWAASQQNQPIQWLPGDEFEAVRKKSFESAHQAAAARS